MDVAGMINTLGFPISCVVALGYWTSSQTKQTRIDGNKREDTLLESSKVTRDDSNAREKVLMDANKEFAVALNKASDAIMENGKLTTALYERMHTVECKVDSIDEKLESIKIIVVKGTNE